MVASMQWLIERRWSCGHVVCTCCRTMHITDMVGGYMVPCTFHGRQYGTSENTDRNISPGELSALSFQGSTREFN